jgi:CRISPR-associated protein Cas1
MQDVTVDPKGMVTMEDVANANFDLPEQRIDTTPAIAHHATGKYPVRLQPDAFERVIAAFEKKLTASFYYPPAEKKITYGDAIIYQAAHYRKVIEGEADVYQPLLLK